MVNLTAMFLQIWAMRYGQEAYRGYFPETPAGSGEVLLFSDSPVQSNAAAEHLYLALVRSAKKEVVFSTPYLLLDDKLLSALSGAVKRGIMVRAILPAIPDKAAIYALTKQNAERLMSFGAEVYIYTPGFNHAKMFAVDGRYAVVGTTNMDFRSFYLQRVFRRGSRKGRLPRPDGDDGGQRAGADPGLRRRRTRQIGQRAAADHSAADVKTALPCGRAKEFEQFIADRRF